MKSHDIQALLDKSGELEFAEVGKFNEGSVGVYWASGGTSPWERHPDDDEFLQVLEGEVDITVMTDDGPVTTRCAAGSVFIVPRGHWHRQTLIGRVRQLYVTPGRTEHSMADDPRIDH